MRTLTLSQPAKCRLHAPDEIIFAFPRVAHHIERALERGSQYTLDEVFGRLLTGHLHLWTYGDEAALVASLIGDECLLLCCGGRNMSNWIHHLADVEAWARSEGCVSLRIQGRKGWSKYGFAIQGRDELGLTIMRKDL